MPAGNRHRRAVARAGCPVMAAWPKRITAPQASTVGSILSIDDFYFSKCIPVPVACGSRSRGVTRPHL